MFTTLMMASAVAVGTVSDEDYQIIHDDLASLPTHVRLTTRYISLSEVDPEDLSEAKRVTSFMLNSCAALRSGAIARPRFLAGGRIARFQVEWYAPAASDLESFLQEWERMAETNPYTCFNTEVTVDGELQTMPVVGGWVPPDIARKVTELSGSICPMVHFGHFLASLEGGSYYRLTGVEDRDETLAKVGIDIEEVTALHADRAATIKRSLVANAKPRRIRLFTGAFGTAWVTYDVSQVTPGKDAVRHPLTNIVVDGTLSRAVEFDAEEYVIVGRNGLPVWLITGVDGARQGVVPPDVARDYSEAYVTFDRQIRPPFSCIRCHAHGGFNDFEDYQKTLAERGQFAYDASTATRIAETYRDDLVQRRLEFDKGVIDESTSLASGVGWGEMSTMVGKMVRRYVYADVEPEEANRVTKANIADVVAPVTTDPYILALAAGESISRAAWFGSAHLALLSGAQNNEGHYHSGSRFHVPDVQADSGSRLQQPDSDSQSSEPRGDIKPSLDPDASSSPRGDTSRSVRRSRIQDGILSGDV